MADVFSKEKRSQIMACVRSQDTKPEIIVRKALFGLGFRFRLHRKDLPGTPDIILPKYKAVIFVHGCFWHGHEGCKRADLPTTRQEYWRDKITRNKSRDKTSQSNLEAAGWKALIVYECELTVKKRVDTINNLVSQLKSPD